MIIWLFLEATARWAPHKTRRASPHGALEPNAGPAKLDQRSTQPRTRCQPYGPNSNKVFVGKSDAAVNERLLEWSYLYVAKAHFSRASVGIAAISKQEAQRTFIAPSFLAVDALLGSFALVLHHERIQRTGVHSDVRYRQEERTLLVAYEVLATHTDYIPRYCTLWLGTLYPRLGRFSVIQIDGCQPKWEIAPPPFRYLPRHYHPCHWKELPRRTSRPSPQLINTSSYQDPTLGSLRSPIFQTYQHRPSNRITVQSIHNLRHPKKSTLDSLDSRLQSL
ncbi:hypothetical protein ACRALDRAFT_2018688 [Sodiomyces alcalophilus JCM 7366]|uniref:uncharacterized protein n=1 Tax=Sodiomyces alcalophilus JCM 7366 TaxID=591952 RepID=UPI0039B51D50